MNSSSIFFMFHAPAGVMLYGFLNLLYTATFSVSFCIKNIINADIHLSVR